MLEQKDIDSINKLLTQGQQILATEPTIATREEMISLAKQKAKGTGLLDMAVESLAGDIVSDISADVSRALGLRFRGGRIGKKVRNIVRDARKNRIHDAEIKAREEFRRKRRFWEAESKRWLELTKMSLRKIHPSSTATNQRKKTMNEQLASRLRNVRKLATKMKRAIDILDHIVTYPEQYITSEEWLTLQAAEKVETSILVKQGEYAKGFVLLEKIIGRAKRHIDWQEPYPSIANLILLKASKNVFQVRLLVGQSPHNLDFECLLKDLRRRGIPIEVRHFGTKRSDVPFHDRFLLTESEVWQIGTSAGGLGLRDALITKIEKPSNIRKRFEELWSAASKT